MQDFRKLRVWQANRQLVSLIYQTTSSFPREERYGLTSQMRSAAISIGSNIAEGCGRGTRADTLRFFQMAFGSATELLHQLITSLDIGFISQEQFAELERKLDPVRRMLARFMARLRDAG